MIHSVIETIITYFTSLSFIDKYGGIVYPLQEKRIDKDGNAVIKTLPIYGNNKTTCNNDDYIDLVPDQRHKSVVYFECTPETVEQEMGSQIRTTCTLTLIAWFNMPRINKAFTADNSKYQAEAMLRNLCNLIKGKHTISGTLADISISEINYRDPGIFSKYTYDEAEKQYLIYPFDFGAVNFSVQLIYDLCDAEPDIDPSCHEVM